MRLGIVCTMINGFGRKGFYNSQEVGLGRALAARGHSVHIYKGVAREEKAETLTVGEGVRIQYIPIGALGPHGYLPVSYLDEALDGIMCFCDQQQFIPHLYNFCKKHGIVFVPYVGTAHSLHENLRGRIMDFLFSLGTLRLYKKLPTLAKTKAAEEEIRSLGARDVTVAPVGLDRAALHPDFEKADRAELKRAWGFLPRDRVILNVSRLDPEKRTLDLADIFASVHNAAPDFRLLIVGEGELKEALEQKIAALGLGDAVRLIPRVPYEKMWELYTLSDYYVNLNRGEIFGMAVMEAVYYRCSVAASLALGPETTLKGMAGHTLCDTDGEVASWLLKPYPSPEALRESGEKMIRDFSWDRCAGAFLALVEKGGRTGNE